MHRAHFFLISSVVACLLLCTNASSTRAQSFVYNRAVFATGAQPTGVVMADFNGDGRLDLAVANSNDTTISILLGKPDGTMSPKADLQSAHGPQQIIAADLNGDGKMDLAVTYDYGSSGGGLQVFLGNGDGTFKPAVNYTVGAQPNGLAAADLNHDGKLDLVVADGGISVLLGNGDGTFNSAKQALTNQGTMWVAVADFNQDGNPDLAVTLVTNTGTIPSPTSSLILLGNGDGTFQAGEEYRTGNTVSTLAAADFNGDGVADLVVVSASGLQLLIGNGDGTFQTPTTIPTTVLAGFSASTVVAADFNHDGKMDIAVGGYGKAYVFLGNGDGTFQSPTDTYAGNFQSEIAVGDVNSDGNLDIAETDYSDNAVALLLGNGDGTFGPVLPLPSLPYYQTAFPFPLTAQGGAIADFTGDGKPDIAVGLGNTYYSGGALVVFPGHGDGTLGAPVISNFNAQAMASADFNEDGKMDLAFSDSNGAGVALSNGDGSFGSVNQILTTPATPAWQVVTGDFNNDGHADVVVMANGAVVKPAIAVFLGNGDGTFRALPPFGDGTLGPTSISAADFNHDGKLDLVVTFNPSGFAVMLGNGDGTFQAPVAYTTMDEPDATVGDVNGDGNPDILVTANSDTSQVDVYLGKGNGTFSSPIDSVSGQVSGNLITADFTGDGKLDVGVVGGLSMSVLTGNGDGTFNSPISIDLVNPQGLLNVGDFNQDGLADAIGGGQSGFLFMARPVISLFPGILSFGMQAQGTVSASKTVTVTNVGAMPVKISQVSASTDFSAVSQCGASLAKGASCTIGVTFAPSGPGLVTGTLVVDDNTPVGVHDLPLVGMGTGPSGQVPQASLTPATLTFPAQTVGTTSASQTVTLSNPGNAALTIDSIVITGDFSQTNNCGSSLGASGSCAIQVTFAPTKGRVRIGTLTVTDNSVNSPGVVTLSGTGNSPHIAFGSTTVDFGVQMINTTSLPQSLTVSNTGPVPLSITNIAVNGDFSLAGSGTTCSPNSPLGAGASCAILMTFSPTAVGSSAGTLTLTDNDDGVVGSIQTVALTGTGTNVAVSLSASGLSFPVQLLGTTSAPQTITVSNTGGTPLSVSGVTTSGDFNQTNNCGSSIGVGGNCTISVTFSPSTVGPLNGNLTISDGATNSPQVAGLSGNGEDFALTISPGSSSSVSVLPGATANYTINVNEEGIGTPMLASFTCTGAPSESMCTISPNPLQVGSVGGITVSVATTAPSEAALRSTPRNIPPPSARGIKQLLFLALVLMSVVWAFTFGRRKGLQRWGLSLLPLAAGLALLFTLSGCGGSGGGGGGGGGVPDPGTPTGTYTLTITGTTGSGTAVVSHAVTLTLKVT